MFFTLTKRFSRGSTSRLCTREKETLAIEKNIFALERIRTSTPWALDPKSSASTIPPLRHNRIIAKNFYESNILFASRWWTPRMLFFVQAPWLCRGGKLVGVRRTRTLLNPVRSANGVPKTPTFSSRRINPHLCYASRLFLTNKKTRLKICSVFPFGTHPTIDRRLKHF